MMSESTAIKYNERLKKFEMFVSELYGLSIIDIHSGDSWKLQYQILDMLTFQSIS